jgi:hypothetical protein
LGAPLNHDGLSEQHYGTWPGFVLSRTHRKSPCLIVPTLCVGMPPGTLRVPLTTHDMSPAQR